MWCLGSGRQVNCLNDSWLVGGTKLVDHTLRPLQDTEKFLRDCDIVSMDWDWDLTRIDDIIPSEFKDSILKLTSPNDRWRS